MSKPFVIFPSESVLLGLALGEFLRLHKLGRDDGIEDVLYRRVHPFVSDLSEEVRTPVREPEGLSAIEWHDEQDGFSRADIPQMPPWWHSDFLGSDEKATDEREREIRAYDEAKAKLDSWIAQLPSAEKLMGLARRDGECYRIDLDDSRESLLDLFI